MMTRFLTVLLVVLVVSVLLSGCTPSDVSVQDQIEERFDKYNMEHSLKIIVDKETGVCYLWQKSGYGVGMTVMLDADGMPLLWEGETDGKADD